MSMVKLPVTLLALAKAATMRVSTLENHLATPCLL
jgi:hypothetical protein